MRNPYGIVHLSLLLIAFCMFYTNASAQNYYFQDKFTDNRNHWILQEQGEIQARIDHGTYIIQRENERGASLFLNPSIPFPEKENFVLKTKLKQLSGSNQYGYGITWGGYDSYNFYAFTISSSGIWHYYKFEDGEYFDLKGPALLQEAIQPMGTINEIKLVYSLELITLYVNDVLAFSAKNHPSFGNKTGLILNANMKVAVDELELSKELSLIDHISSAPKIIWLSPENKVTEYAYDIVRLEAGIQAESPLKNVLIYRNHQLVKNFSEHISTRGNYALDFDEIIAYELELEPGINQIVIKAEDYNGQITESTRLVKRSIDLSENRKDYALLFAVNEYDNWGNLINPLYDAKAIAHELTLYYGFEVELVENPTTAEVMNTLKNYARKKYNPKEQLLVFFAGHGKFDDAFGEGYVVCKNSLKNDDGNTSYLSHSQLRTVINNIPCDHVLLMMDVCFAGTFDPTVANSSHRGDDDDREIYRELTRKQYIDRKLQFKTRKYLTSGGKEYVPDGTPGNHSPFARKTLEALRSYGGNDRILTFTELLHYLEKVKPEPRAGEFGNNEPGSDFMFIAK